MQEPATPNRPEEAPCVFCGHHSHQHVETRSGARPPRVFCVARRGQEDRARVPLCGCTHYVRSSSE
ncbi:MAG TPA: hypothetical protein VLI07_12155 [Candidatus Binatus sp.]|nr:hypothetical protein [Candidatus Binatus sp.]